VDWTLQHLYRSGDIVHLLHCIPVQGSGRTAFSNGVDEKLITVDTSTGADKIIKQRHWSIMDAVRKQFEAKLVSQNVPKEDLVYDIVQERPPAVTVTGMFGMSDLVQDATVADASDVDGEEAFDTPQMVGDVIVGKAEEVNAAAVVMASHNKSSLAEFFLGSITNFCTHHCTKPVVVLHNLPHGPGDELPSEDTPSVEGRQLAVAVDDSQHSEKALRWTMDNLYREGDTVHIIHVVPKVSQRMVVNEGLGMSIEEGGAVHAHNLADVSERFRDMCEAEGVSYQIDLMREMKGDSVKSLGSAIVSKAHEVGASSIVMASHSRGFFEEFVLGSVTNYVTHHCTDIPVVVLHP